MSLRYSIISESLVQKLINVGAKRKDKFLQYFECYILIYKVLNMHIKYVITYCGRII